MGPGSPRSLSSGAHSRDPLACPGRRGVSSACDGGRREAAFSRHEMSELSERTALETEEGAGKAGCPPHPWSACNKKHAAEPQVQADHPAFPAQWFYGLYVISPVTIAWLPPSPVRRESVFTTLTPALERQDHTTSPSA